MSNIFYGCSSLKKLPDISKWDMKNVKDISYMFYLCSSLISLPDISKWNTQNINNLNSIFENCSLLTFIPNISKWKFKNTIRINDIFKGCNSLLIIPDIPKWNISEWKIDNPVTFITSSFNSNLIKGNENDSINSEDILKNYNSIENIFSLKTNIDNKSFESINSKNNSKKMN